MNKDDLLDMDYSLNEDDPFDDEFGEEGFDIVNIGLHFFLKNVPPYAASCSEA